LKTAQTREEKTLPKYKATDYEPVPPGLYTATLEQIEEATSQHGTYYSWVFAIEDEGEFQGRKVRANVLRYDLFPDMVCGVVQLVWRTLQRSYSCARAVTLFPAPISAGQAFPPQA
jgi:hypothetical protein